MNLRKDILATLAYFDIFNYPLTQFEIFQFLPNKYEYKEFTIVLHALGIEKNIFKLEDFFCLQKNHSLIVRRKKANQEAQKLLHQAERIAQMLYCFPFVKGVAVSGSLSKNYADERSDIDYFIITSKNRLWIARTLLHCLKKISFLIKKQHYFCMNYFIDEEALTIVEKNIFTATELATLLPMNGQAAFKSLYLQNIWTKSYLPNHLLKVAYMQDRESPLLKRVIEFILKNRIWDQLDKWLMKSTAKRWDKKSREGKINSRGILMGITATRHCCKPDPVNYQNKLLSQYENKVQSLLLKEAAVVQ